MLVNFEPLINVISMETRRGSDGIRRPRWALLKSASVVRPLERVLEATHELRLGRGRAEARCASRDVARDGIVHVVAVFSTTLPPPLSLQAGSRAQPS